MKTKVQKIKQLNITTVFKEIDHILITAEKMRKVFNLTEEEKKNSPFLEPSQDIKILGIPNKQKDIIIEINRLRINDNSGKNPDESDIIKYFQIAFNCLVDKNKLTSYGFNYDVLVESEKKINFKKLIGNALVKTLSGTSILESGARVLFTKKEIRYDLQISPIKDPYKVLFHLNAHYSLKEINFSQLQIKLNKNYLELIKIINKI